jgi:hypothetical protein
MYAVDDVNALCHLLAEDKTTCCGLKPVSPVFAEELEPGIFFAPEKPSLYASCPKCFPSLNNSQIKL